MPNTSSLPQASLPFHDNGEGVRGVRRLFLVLCCLFFWVGCRSEGEAQEGGAAPLAPAGALPLDPAGVVDPRPRDAGASLAPLSPNEGDPAAVAMALCPYAQGPLLEWHLLEAFEHLLSEADRGAAKAIQAQVLAALPTVADRAHDFAARLYASQRVVCVLTKSQPMQDGNVRVFMAQTRVEPQEPSADIGLDRTAPLEIQAAQWLDAFEKNTPATPNPTADQAQTLALLMVSEGGVWRLSADLETKILKPLERQKALDALPKHVTARRWLEAAEGMRWVCAVDHLKDLCVQWQPIVAEGLRNHFETSGVRAQARVLVSGPPTRRRGQVILPLRVWTPSALRLLWVRVAASDVMGRPLAFEAVCEVAWGETLTDGSIAATCALASVPAEAVTYSAEAQDLRLKDAP